MKTILFRLAILGTCLLQAGCASGMLRFGSSTSGDEPGALERISAAAFDVATAPIQLPVLLAIDPPSLPGKKFPEQIAEEKQAVRDLEQKKSKE